MPAKVRLRLVRTVLVETQMLVRVLVVRVVLHRGRVATAVQCMHVSRMVHRAVPIIHPRDEAPWTPTIAHRASRSEIGRAHV